MFAGTDGHRRVGKSRDIKNEKEKGNREKKRLVGWLCSVYIRSYRTRTYFPYRHTATYLGTKTPVLVWT